MNILTAALTAAALTAGGAAADGHDHKHDHDGEHRELGAHVHGEGALQIAIEGPHLEAALEAPGMDIVGFEHHPKSAEEIAAVNAAFAALAQPLTLLGVPEAGECHVAGMEIELEFEGDGEDHDHDHDAKGDDHAKEHAHNDHAHDDHAHEGEARHSAFHASYALHCHEIDALDALKPSYFETFPNGEKLDVTLLSDAGQNAVEISKGAARIPLK